MDQLTDWIGIFAAIFTTLSLFPQAWCTFKSRKVDGINIGMYAVLITGVGLWFVYGLLLHAWPVIIANAITLVMSTSILSMRFLFGRKMKELPDESHSIEGQPLDASQTRGLPFKTREHPPECGPVCSSCQAKMASALPSGQKLGHPTHPTISKGINNVFPLHELVPSTEAGECLKAHAQSDR